MSSGGLAELTLDMLIICEKILMVYTEQRKPRVGSLRVLLKAGCEVEVVFD